MELAIGAVICIAVAGILIYSMRDEDHNSWDD
jgi:hypothetical protein